MNENEERGNNLIRLSYRRLSIVIVTRLSYSTMIYCYIKKKKNARVILKRLDISGTAYASHHNLTLATAHYLNSALAIVERARISKGVYIEGDFKKIMSSTKVLLNRVKNRIWREMYKIWRNMYIAKLLKNTKNETKEIKMLKRIMRKGKMYYYKDFYIPSIDTNVIIIEHKEKPIEMFFVQGRIPDYIIKAEAKRYIKEKL